MWTKFVCVHAYLEPDMAEGWAGKAKRWMSRETCWWTRRIREQFKDEPRIWIKEKEQVWQQFGSADKRMQLNRNEQATERSFKKEPNLFRAMTSARTNHDGRRASLKQGLCVCVCVWSGARKVWTNEWRNRRIHWSMNRVAEWTWVGVIKDADRTDGTIAALKLNRT